MKQLLLIIFTLSLFISCKKSQPLQVEIESKHGLITQKAMVVSARVEASKIGSDILEKGGNVLLP